MSFLRLIVNQHIAPDFCNGMGADDIAGFLTRRGSLRKKWHILSSLIAISPDLTRSSPRILIHHDSYRSIMTYRFNSVLWIILRFILLELNYNNPFKIGISRHSRILEFPFKLTSFTCHRKGTPS